MGSIRGLAKIVLLLTVAGGATYYYVLCLVLAAQGNADSYGWLLWIAAALGAIAIELAAACAWPLMPPKRQAAAARTWAVALGVALGVHLSAGGTLFPPTAVAVLVIGLWWPRRVLSRDSALRPGYVIGGAALASVVFLTDVTTSYLVWVQPGRLFHSRPSARTLGLLVLRPVWLALPIRVLLAGLPGPLAGARALRTWKATLVAMALVSTWGCATMLRYFLLRPLPTGLGTSAALAMMSLVWAVTVLWVGRLWAAPPDAVA